MTRAKKGLYCHMQIFFTNKNPIIAADDISFIGHKPDGRKINLGNKMTTESFQLIAFQLYLDGHTKEKLVGSPDSHESHECRIWLGQDPANMQWLLGHAMRLYHIHGPFSGSKINCITVPKIKKLVDKHYAAGMVNPPVLAMRTTRLDLCEKYGQKIHATTHTGKPKEYFVANDIRSGIDAYVEFLQSKDYYNNPEFIYYHKH